MLRIKLVESPQKNTPRNRATVKALGLRKMNSVVEHHDTPTIRGMIFHVKHLLQVTEVAGEPTKKQSPFERPKSRTKAAVAPKRAKTVAKAEAEAPAKEAAKPVASAPAAKKEPKAAAKPKAAAEKPKAAKPAPKKTSKEKSS